MSVSQSVSQSVEGEGIVNVGYGLGTALVSRRLRFSDCMWPTAFGPFANYLTVVSGIQFRSFDISS
jgi:hypothetical protein